VLQDGGDAALAALAAAASVARATVVAVNRTAHGFPIATR
jgi:hypothetical protein